MKTMKVVMIAMVLAIASFTLISCELLVPRPASPVIHLLVIALDYQNNPTVNSLSGTINDAVELAAAFEKRGQLDDLTVLTTMMLQEGTTPLRLDSHYPSKANILAQIAEIGERMTEQDLYVMYYSGHGIGSTLDVQNPQRGNLVTARTADQWYETLSTSELASALEPIPGTKLLMMDSCFSGHHINEYPDGFISYFQPLEGFDGKQFYLMAASDTQLSWEDDIGTGGFAHRHGFFTFLLLEALGWDHFKTEEENPDTLVQGTFTYDVDGLSYQHSYQGGMRSDGYVPARRSTTIGILDILRYIAQHMQRKALNIPIQTTSATEGPRDLVLFDSLW